jgi:hypothetical protein
MPEARHTDLHVHGERSEGREHEHEGQTVHRQGTEPHRTEQQADRTDEPRHAHAGGEELEQEQRETDREEKIGRRRRGDGVEEPRHETQLEEPGRGGLAVHLPVLADAVLDRVEGAALDGDPVHRQEDVAQHRHAAVVTCELQDLLLAGLEEPECPAAENVVRRAERDGRTVHLERRAGAADTRTRRHRRDVRNGHHLRGQPVQP